jgi:hypothetical protein
MSSLDLERAPSGQCAAHRDGVGELEITAVRDAAGDTSDHHGERRDLALDQQCRRFPIDARGRRYDDLGDLPIVNSLDESLKRQVVRAHSFERREQLAEDEIASPHRSSALDGHQVVDTCDDAQHARIPIRIRAHIADRFALANLGYIAANPAGAEFVAQRYQLLAQGLGDGRVGRKKPKHIPLRRLLSHAGKSG